MLLWVLSLAALVAGDVEVTLVGLGKLRGKEGVTRNNHKYQQFLGIPYAEPPTGDRRFRNPVPVSSWEEEGVRSASEFGPVCLQMPYSAPDMIEGSENCLYLNIYTKDVTASKPVLFYIHGGSFIAGDPQRLTGEYLLEEDIVLVTVQYRLGPLGWLTTADGEAPGNYGLQDQLLALRWVQQHIGAFGGDKAQVTIAGMSAGGASVNYLLLSPQTDGLFSRAFSMSGSAMAWWANIPHQERTAQRLGEAMDCPTVDSAAMIQCLQEKSASQIMAAQTSLYAWHHDRVEKEPLTIWSPRPDLEAKEDAILPLDPGTAMSVGQMQPVPFLVGVAESEGAWQAANYLEQDEVMVEFLKNFDDVAIHTLGLENQVKSGDMAMVIKKIKEFYLSGMVKETDPQKKLDSVTSGMVNMMGDALFNYPIDRMVKLQGNKAHSKVWVYQYNYKHNHSLAFFDPQNPGQVRKPGLKALTKATHGHELSMLFPAFEKEMGPLSEEETKHSKKFVKFVADFMVNGHPKGDGKYEYSDWEPVANGQLTYFIHGKYSASNKGLPNQHRMKWWNELPVYWKKNPEEPVKKADVDDFILGEVEELTKEELEELEAKLVLEEMKVKDEL